MKFINDSVDGVNYLRITDETFSRVCFINTEYFTGDCFGK